MKVNQITNSSQFQIKRSENNAKSAPAMKLNTLQQDTVSFNGGKQAILSPKKLTKFADTIVVKANDLTSKVQQQSSEKIPKKVVMPESTGLDSDKDWKVFDYLLDPASANTAEHLSTHEHFPPVFN
jgi:hypothetical protein